MATTYTIWRVGPDIHPFQLTTTGATTSRERAVEKARALNEKLLASEPRTQEVFVVRDESGKEYRAPAPAATPA